MSENTLKRKKDFLIWKFSISTSRRQILSDRQSLPEAKEAVAATSLFKTSKLKIPFFFSAHFRSWQKFLLEYFLGIMEKTLR